MLVYISPSIAALSSQLVSTCIQDACVYILMQGTCMYIPHSGSGEDAAVTLSPELTKCMRCLYVCMYVCMLEYMYVCICDFEFRVD